MSIRFVQGLTAALLTLCILTGCTSCGGGAAVAPPPPPDDRLVFDGEAALASIVTQCDFGPRTPGSDAHDQCATWLEAELRKLTDQVVVQSFDSDTPFGGPYAFKNLLAVFPGKTTAEPLLLGSHWDSRPFADQDPLPANRTKPVPGANDGASGVGVLLELGRLLKDNQPTRTIILGFFDAEDSGKSGLRTFPYMGFCIGSNYLAENWPSEAPRPTEMVLLDMVGADRKNNPRLQLSGQTGPPEFELEQHSLDSDPSLVDAIWSAADDLGHKSFVRRNGGAITDDHVPFIDNGIAGVDIIHFAPAEWHTVDDTPEHCSAATLFEVGDTLVSVVWE